MASASPKVNDALAKLREELAKEQAELHTLEEDVESKAAQLGYLHTEYFANLARLSHHYEPKIQPHVVVTYSVAVKQEYIRSLISWLEKKTVEQEKRSQTGVFVEQRDMLPAANDFMNKARKKLLDSYESINSCPADALRIISNYQCPPDQAIETLEMVMRVRGEEDCSWKAAKVVMSHNYFTGFFVTRSEGMLKTKDTLDDVFMEELEAFCELPSHSVEALYVISTPLGCLGEWLHAVRDYYRVKIITAPLLLRDTSSTNKKRVLALQHKLAFGVAPPADELNDDEDDKEAAAGQLVAATATTDVDGAKAGTVLVNDKEMERDLLAQYARTKKNLMRLTQAGAVTQQLIVDLRHRMNKLSEDTAEAQKTVAAYQSEMATKVKEIQGDYDTTMMPLHEQLENTTEDFVRLITHTA